MIQKTLKAAEVKRDQIKETILVGGSSKLPKFFQIVNELFESSDNHFGTDDGLDIAFGSAIHSATYSTNDEKLKTMKHPPTEFCLIEVLSMTTGFELVQGQMEPIIKKATNIPITDRIFMKEFDDIQDTFRICVYQSDGPDYDDRDDLMNKVSKCTKVGEYEIAGYDQDCKSETTVKVHLEIDSYGK